MSIEKERKRKLLGKGANVLHEGIFVFLRDKGHKKLSLLLFLFLFLFLSFPSSHLSVTFPSSIFCKRLSHRPVSSGWARGVYDVIMSHATYRRLFFSAYVLYKINQAESLLRGNKIVSLSDDVTVTNELLDDGGASRRSANATVLEERQTSVHLPLFLPPLFLRLPLYVYLSLALSCSLLLSIALYCSLLLSLSCSFLLSLALSCSLSHSLSHSRTLIASLRSSSSICFPAVSIRCNSDASVWSLQVIQWVSLLRLLLVVLSYGGGVVSPCSIFGGSLHWKGVPTAMLGGRLLEELEDSMSAEDEAEDCW